MTPPEVMKFWLQDESSNQISHTSEGIILWTSLDSKYTKIMLQNVFLGKPNRGNRNRQSPFNFPFLSFFFLLCSLILSLHKVIWKRASFWRLEPLFIGSYFAWLPFPSLPSLLRLVLTYSMDTNVTKGHNSGIIKYVFSGTGRNKILKHDL